MKLISESELDEAFDGDFGEIAFDHKPTVEDIFLIKLGLVAQAQLESCEKEHDKEVQAIKEKHRTDIKAILEQHRKEWEEVRDEG